MSVSVGQAAIAIESTEEIQVRGKTGTVSPDELERSRIHALKPIARAQKKVLRAAAGNKRAQRWVRQYFGEHGMLAVGKVADTPNGISIELAGATIALGELKYLANRAARGNTVGMYVEQGKHSDTIFYNPSLSGSVHYFAAQIVKESAHLAGDRGHQEYLGAIAYGRSASAGLASLSVFSAPSNPPNFACAVYTGVSNC